MKRNIKSTEINYHPETSNSEAYFEVKINGETVSSFDKRPKAEKFIEEERNTIVLMSNKKGSGYLRGVIKRAYFPLSGTRYFLAVKSFSGDHKFPLGKILDTKAKSEEKLIDKLKEIKKKHNLKTK